MNVTCSSCRLISVLTALLLSLSFAHAVEKTGTINADESWSGSIEITGHVTIAEGVTVTVSPGTIIKLNAGRILYVDGTFNATGTSGSKIYFTSYADDSLGGDTNGDGGATTPAAGDWARIANLAGDTANTTLKHVEIRYGGSGSAAAVYQGSGDMLIENVTIQDCSTGGVQYAGSTLREFTMTNLTLTRVGTTTSHHGVRVSNSNVRLTSTNLTTTDVSGRHVFVSTGIWAWNSSGSSFSGTGIKAIAFSASTWDGDFTWDDDVPYFITGDMRINPGASLTIAPGTIVKGDGIGRITNNGGTLNALGTEAEPIYFTSIFNDAVGGDTNGDAAATTPATKDWDGFSSTHQDSTSTLTHCHFSYAGDGLDAAINSSRGMLTVEDSSVSNSGRRAVYVNDGDVIFRRNTFTDAEWAAMWLRNNNGFAILEENHFEDCQASPYAFDPGVNLQAFGTTAVNCGNANAIVIDGSNSWIQEDQIWQEALPYYIKIDMTTADAATWTLIKGTEVKVALDKKITVRGGMNAQGTEDEPVKFTSVHDDLIGGDTFADGNTTEPLPGDWDGFEVWNNGDLDWDYTEVHYAGKGTGEYNSALYFNGNANFDINNATFANTQNNGISLRNSPGGIVQNSTFKDIGGYGFYSRANSGGPLITVLNNTFENTGKNGLYYALNANIQASGNTFIGGGVTAETRIRAGKIPAGQTVIFEGDRTYLLYNADESRGELEIERGGSLIVEAGAILKFGSRWSIRQDGNLDLLGTPDKPVILTSYKDDSVGGDSNGDGNGSVPNPGDWMSIWIRDTFLERWGAATGIWENVEIRFAGIEPIGAGEGTPAVLLDGGVFEMKNITITDAFDAGFRSRNSVGTATIDGLTIIGTGAEALNLLDGNIDLKDVYLDEIDGPTMELRLGTLDFNIDGFETGENMVNNITRLLEGSTRNHVTLGHTPVVAMVGRVGVERQLDQTESSITILPGTIWKFTPTLPGLTYGLFDGDRGFLNINGTPENPIIFTSLLDDSIGGDTNGDGNATSPGWSDWSGISLVNLNSSISNVEVRYGGHSGAGVSLGAWNWGNVDYSVSGLHIHKIGGAGLNIRNPGTIDVSNSLIYDIEEQGIFAYGNRTGSVTLRNNTVYGGKTSIHLGLSDFLLANNIFSGASDQGMLVVEATDNPVSRHNIYDNANATNGDFWVEWTSEAFALTDSTGDLMVDPKFVFPQNQNFELDAGSPAMDAADGTLADGVDFRGFPRFDDPAETDSGIGSPSYADIGAMERLGSSDPTFNPDLTVDESSIVFITTGGKFYSLSEMLNDSSYVAGQEVEVEYKVMNEGASAALGNWSDALYFSRNGDWDILDTFAGSSGRPNTLGSGESYTNSIVTTIPFLVDSSYHLIVRADNNAEQLEYKDGNNASASADTYTVDVESRSSVDAFSETFPAGQKTTRMYKIDASGDIGNDLCVEVTATGSNARIELLAKSGDVPTIFDNDAKADGIDGEATNIQTPISGDGMVYVLVTVDDPGPEPNNVSIEIQVKGFSISAVSPPEAGNNGPATLFISGAAFSRDDEVSIRHVDGDPAIPANRVIFNNSGNILASFNFAEEKLGNYDVIVTRPDDSVVLVSSFKIIVAPPGGEFKVPKVKVIAPSELRENPLSPVPMTVVVTNPYPEPIKALINFGGEDEFGQPTGIYSTDPNQAGSNSFFIIPHSATGMIGVLAPFEEVEVTVYHISTGTDPNDPSFEPASHDGSGGTIFNQSAVPRMESEDLCQTAASTPVDNTKLDRGEVDDDSAHHTAFLERVGTTLAEAHQAAIEEAIRLASYGIKEYNMQTLMSNIYHSVTGRGNNTLTGVVKNVDGQELGGTEITLVGEGEEGRNYNMTTESDGSFSANNLPSGSYRVIADDHEISSRSVVVHGGKTMTGEEFALDEGVELEEEVDTQTISELTLIRVDGVPHLFFVFRGTIMHSVFENGEWKTPQLVAKGTGPVPLYSPTLFDGAPAIGVIHESVGGEPSEDLDAPIDLNDARVMLSMATKNEQGMWIWHEAKEYASHPDASFTEPNAILTQDGVPLVVWVSADATNSAEDGDHYWNLRLFDVDDFGNPITPASFASEPVAAKYENPFALDYHNFEAIQEFRYPSDFDWELPDWDPKQHADICKGWKVGFSISQTIVKWPYEFPEGSGKKVPVPKVLLDLFGSNEVKIAVKLDGEANILEGKAAGGAEMELKFFYNKETGEGLFVKGNGLAGFAWKTDTDECKYVFKNALLGIGITGRARIPAPWPQIKLGPLLEARMGLQIDLGIGADLTWDRPRILPTGGKLKASGGIGGYAVGTALAETLVVGGFLTGNVNLEADTSGNIGFKDISIKGSLSAEVKKLSLKKELKFQLVFIDGRIVSSEGLFEGGDGFSPLAMPGLDPVVVMAADDIMEREYFNSKGWAVKETITRLDPTGTGNSYVLGGVAQALLADVASDMVGDDRPELFITNDGKVGAIWARDPSLGGDDFNTRLMYSEFDGTSWSTPISIAGISGINREVKVVRDMNDELLAVFSQSRMTGLTKASPVGDIIEAYEESDLCYIRKTESGWTFPQLLSAAPGMANSLRLHRLPDGTVYVTWIESFMNKGSMVVQKWDPEMMLWLPPQTLSDDNPQSNAVIGLFGEEVRALWGELIDFGDGTSFNEIGERFVYSVLNNGSWSAPMNVDMPFAFYPDEPASEGSGLAPSEAFTMASDQTRFEVSDLFDLNTYVTPPSGCCENPPDEPGLLNRILTVTKEAIERAIACGKKIISGDPNDKYGMYAYGPNGWITANNTIPYKVTYENNEEAMATGPAQRVRIFDKLDSDYDFDTFQFKRFGWADLVQEVPENTQNFETLVDWQNMDGSPLKVKVVGSFDRSTGEIEMLYDSIDPDTGVSPYGAFDGFLPVEDGSGIGQGFIDYTVKQKPDLPQGTRFENKADIYFDLNEVIETPTLVHTIDLEKPTSSASSPDTSESSTFTISLNGSDPGGSGIGYYQIYQSVDDGPWSYWKSSPDSNPSFTGEVGRKYSFYSIAVDNVGLSEEKDPIVETTTLITGSDLNYESIEILDEDTLRVVINVPAGLGADIRGEEADLIDPYLWGDYEGVVFTDLGDNRFEVLVPYDENTSQFFRFIISDQPPQEP